MALKFVDEIELEGKKVIARFDFNVPLVEKDGVYIIADTTRVDRALPTINHILEQGASKLILMSHLGRPKNGPEKQFSLEPVATYLAEKLGEDVCLTESATDEGIRPLLKLRTNKIICLENLRFHKEEKGCDPDFARTLSEYADIYVNDAFGTCHRKHASTYQINAYFNDNSRVGGFILKQEIKALSNIIDFPKKPLMAVIGGAKVSDKIKIIERLQIMVEKLCIGGAMAYPFLKAQGVNVGKSLCSDDDVKLAKKILTQDRGGKIVLPSDHVVATSMDDSGRVCEVQAIPDNEMGLDIGPKTCKQYKEILGKANTIFWNGPMGLFEKEHFAKGTREIGEFLGQTDAFTLVGGGDSVRAINEAKLEDKISHISTGGGASLEFIEQGDLPGLKALKFGV